MTLVDEGIASRNIASNYLNELTKIRILKKEKSGMNLCTSIYRCMNYLQNNKRYTGSVHIPEECTNIIVISAY